MRWQALDKLDTSLYKGMAILLIVTHNFMHLFPKPRENEFEFYRDRTMDFIHLVHTEPENILRLLLSFFGHFGVQVFVFLSAYGLSKKYLLEEPQYWNFLWQRIAKIYPAFLLAIVMWVTIEGWIIGGYGLTGPLKVLFWNIEPLLIKLSLLSNFVPDLALQPIGPWWFIPFIFQFYVIFPWLRRLYARNKTTGLLAISAASILLAIASGGTIGGVNIYFTILGHLPVFCLGIYLANKPAAEVVLPTTAILVALVVFVLGNFYEVFWHVSHLAFAIVLLAAFNILVKYIKKSNVAKAIVTFFGVLSMELFLVNGFLREPYFSWAMAHDYWLLTIALCFISLATSTLAAVFLARITARLMLNINSATPTTFYNDINRNFKRLIPAGR